MKWWSISLLGAVVALASCAEATTPSDAGTIEKTVDGAPDAPDARPGQPDARPGQPDAIPGGQNGSVCAGDGDCASGHCENGFCCASGDCCAMDVHCTDYDGPSTCDVVASCTGSRDDGTCNAAFQCQSTAVSDPNACDDLLAGGTCSTGLLGACAIGANECQGGATTCVQTVFPTAEVCGDGVDQDCDGTPDDGCVCDPLNPAAVCGGGYHCLPTTTGATVCDTPIGGGIQYSICSTRAECSSIYECVNTGFGTTYCMKWCRMGFADCTGIDLCTGLAPAIYVGAQEYGVCYDGFP